MLAQGGICVQRDETDYDSFFEDTLKAGHYENRKESVDIMIRNSRAVINDLLALGVRFDKEADGSLKYTREGAHAKPRICFHKDITGKEITETLLRNVQALPNVTIMDYTVMEDLLVEGNTCHGIVAKAENGDILRIHAENTVLATGGIGGLYEHSTNFPSLTGDALRLAEKYGVELENMDYVQIHPTSLYSEKPGRHFLISESARGEGAILLNSKGERFVNELLPRDKVSAAIHAEMEKEGTKHVWLSFAPVPAEDIENHFPNIYQKRACARCAGTALLYGRHPCRPSFQNNHGASLRCRRNQLQRRTRQKQTGKQQPSGKPCFRRKSSTAHCRKGRIRMNPITMQIVADKYIRMALEEDINSEDVSTNAVMPRYQLGTVDLICKQDGIIAGLDVFARAFQLLDEKTEIAFHTADGDAVKKGQLLATVTGDIRVLLSAERTALNYLQRMSGIATYTNAVAKLLAGTKTTLLDTRKTTPCMRVFEKYAVTVGGGSNHRYNLSDGVMLKDNHIGAAGGVKEAIAAAKAYAPFVRKIEVETETLDMVREAVEAGADIIMLDNMSPAEMAEAIRIIDGRAQTECSGNMTIENIKTITALGVDYVSSGALTHSAPILDISLKNLHAVE